MGLDVNKEILWSYPVGLYIISLYLISHKKHNCKLFDPFFVFIKSIQINDKTSGGRS